MKRNQGATSYWDKLKFFSKDALTNPSNINQNIITFKSQYEVFNCNGLKVFHAATKNEVEKAYNTDCFNKIAVAIAEAIIGLNMYLKKLYNGFDSTGGASIKINESTNLQSTPSLTKSNYEKDQLKTVLSPVAIEPFLEIEYRLKENQFLNPDYSLKGQKKALLALIQILTTSGYLKSIRGKTKRWHFIQYRKFFESRYKTDLKEMAKPSKFNPETDTKSFVHLFFFIEAIIKDK